MRAASPFAFLVVISGLVGCGSSSDLGPDGGGDAMAADATAAEGGGLNSEAASDAPSQGHWQTLPSMPDPARFYVGVAALGQSVFVIGGFMTPQSTVAQVFDTKAGTWQTLDPLPAPFSMPNVAVVGDRLFVLGALQAEEVLEYDNQGHWMQRAPMPLANGRGSAFVGVWGTKVVIAGGVIPGQSNNDLNTGFRYADVVMYDTVADSWQTLTPMTVARAYGMGAVVGDTFWVIGGSTNDARTAAVQSLDLVTGQWHDNPPLDQSLSSAALGVVGDRMYLIGGIASSSGIVSPSTLLYNQTDGTLTTLASMPNPRFASGGAVVGGSIYVAGGIVMASPTDVHAVTTFDVFTP